MRSFSPFYSWDFIYDWILLYRTWNSPSPTPNSLPMKSDLLQDLSYWELFTSVMATFVCHKLYNFWAPKSVLSLAELMEFVFHTYSQIVCLSALSTSHAALSQKMCIQLHEIWTFLILFHVLFWNTLVYISTTAVILLIHWHPRLVLWGQHCNMPCMSSTSN